MEITDFLTKRADLSPDRVGLVDTASGRRLTYAQLDDRAGRAAAALGDQFGIKAGQRVAALVPNGSDLMEMLFACARLGALFVPLNWRLSAGELSGIIADASPSVLVGSGAFAATLDALEPSLEGMGRIALGGPPAPGEAYEDLLGQHDPIEAPAFHGADEPWYLLYTSGTTGQPKGVIQTFGMAVANHLNIGIAVGLTDRDTTLNVLPMFHTGGLNLYTMPTLIAGGTAITPSAFDPTEALELLAGDVTAFFGVPAIYQMLADAAGFDAADLSGVRTWACGGAPMPVVLLRRLADRGIAVRQGFGMTETGPTCTLLDAEHAVEKAGSIGKPQLFAHLRVVDRDGVDVPDGEMGELWVRGPGVTPGYWGRPDATREAIDPDGWLRTGDVARRDADGDYYIVDRWKDMFISGGENVYPVEVEQVLAEHPAVADVAVIGVPDDRWGEVGHAVVVGAPDASVDADELIAFCRSRLASYKVPRSVEVVTELPRNAAGKVLKRTLRDRFGVGY